MLYAKSSNDAINFSNWDLVIDNYSVKNSIEFLIVHWIFWLIVAVYLDQVVPNEFGKKRHPLFPFIYLRNKIKDLFNINKMNSIHTE